MNCEIIMSKKPTEWEILEIDSLSNIVFTQAYPIEKLQERLNQSEDIRLYYIVANEKMVAFKIGYQWNEETFYSWIGGVNPEHRRKGLAKSLLLAMQNDLEDSNYKILRTHSRNQFPQMIALNLNNGFYITDTIASDDPLDPKIVFQKNL